MNKNLNRVKECVESVCGERYPNVTDRLVEDLGFDSLDVVDLELKLEKEFGILINDTENEYFMLEVGTVGDILPWLIKNKKIEP